MPASAGVVQDAGVPRRPSISTRHKRQEPNASSMSVAQSFGIWLPSVEAAAIQFGDERSDVRCCHAVTPNGLAHVVHERTAATQSFGDDHLAPMSSQQPDCGVIDVGVQDALRATSQQSNAFLPTGLCDEGLGAVIGAG